MQLDRDEAEGRKSKEKRLYTRPKTTALTPDQAAGEVMAKATPGNRELQNCFELITEVRKLQRHS
jgi:hypothetical protein